MKAKQFLQVLICLALLASCTPPAPSPAAVSPTAVLPSVTVTASTPAHRPWRTPAPTELDEFPTDEPATPTAVPTIALPPPIENPNWTRAGQPLPAGLPVISPENAARLSRLAVWGKGKILDLTYNPDGRRIAALTALGLYIYDASTYELLEFRPMAIPGDVWISPDIGWIAAKYGWKLAIWNAETGKQTYEWESINSLPLKGYLGFDVWGFNRQNRLLVSLSDGEEHMKTFIYDPDANVWTETGGSDKFSSFVASADGRIAAAGISVNQPVTLSPTPPPVAIWRLDRPDEPVIYLHVEKDLEEPGDFAPMALSPDGSLLALGETWGLRLLVYRVSDLKLLYVLDTPEHVARTRGLAAPLERSGPGNYIIASLAFSSDGKRLAALNGFGRLIQYDTATGDPLAFSAIRGGSKILYSPDGQTIAKFGSTASFLDVRRNNWVYTLPEHTGGIRAIDFSPDGRALAFGGDDGLVWLRSARDGALQKIYAGHSGEISHLAYAPNGTTIATGSSDRTVRLWNVHSGSGSILWEADDWIEQMTWSPDGKYIAYNCYECDHAEFIRVSDGAYYPFDAYPFYAPLHFIENDVIAVSAGYSDEGTGVDLITVGEEGPDDTIPLPAFDVACFNMDPARKLIATCNNEVIRISNIQDGSTRLEIPALPAITGEYEKTLVFSPDGKLLFGSGDAGTAVWDASTGELLQTFPFYNIDDHIEYAFSPDGTLLAYGDYDGLIHIYGVLPSAP